MLTQWEIAAIACVAFMGFGVFAYIFNEERKSRKVLRSGRVEVGPDGAEKRARRAF